MNGTVTISLKDYEELKKNSQNWLAKRYIEQPDDEKRLRAKRDALAMAMAIRKWTKGASDDESIEGLFDALHQHGIAYLATVGENT